MTIACAPVLVAATARSLTVPTTCTPRWRKWVFAQVVVDHPDRPPGVPGIPLHRFDQFGTPPHRHQQ